MRENLSPGPAYTKLALDRATILRHDAERVGALLKGGAAKFVPVWKQQHLVDESGAVFLDYARVSVAAESPSAPLVFLGFVEDTPWFAIGLSESDTPPAFGMNATYRMLTDVVGILPSDHASLLAYARAMVIWHENHRYCGRCGAPTILMEAGHSLVCTAAACSQRIFPRTDPVVITLVTDGARCLLGRQATWPAGMYSTIAGFVEPGETLEAAVRRETAEETGIIVGEVRYVASQPWPFPASLMLGFRAQALSTDIHRDDNELEDCRWFTHADIARFTERDAPGDGFKLPGRYAIARHLLEDWLRE